MRAPTSDQLLDAALEQFALVGLRRTSADDIARRAGVNRATLYRRLGSRDEIVSAALLHEAGKVLTEIEAKIGPVPPPGTVGFDPRDYVATFFRVTLTTLRDNRLLQRMLLVDPEQTLTGLTAGAGETLALSAGLVEDRVRRLREHVAPPHRGRHEVSLLSLTLARLTQSLIVTPAAGPDLSSQAAMTHYAHTVVVPMVLGDLSGTEPAG